MELRPLGATGLAVSPLGLGTVKFGRNAGVKYPRPFDLPSDQQALTLLETAWELGINLLDTAPAYGVSEERLGRLLQHCRRDWVIATKVGEEFVDGISRFDFSGPATEASVERSLRRLGVEVLDIVLIHSDGNDLKILEQEAVLTTLLNLKQAGLVRAVGISTKTVAGSLRAVDCCDLVMLTYNRRELSELPAIRAAHAANKGILIKKALQSGHLPEGAQPDSLQAALRFVYAQPGVDSVVIGTLNPDHLWANVRAVERVLADANKNGDPQTAVECKKS